MKRSLMTAFGIAGFCAAAISQGGPELERPFRVTLADGAAIDVDVGHAAPLLADFDKDGVQDLLVGQFGEGRLRIYRNTGTNTAPAFKAFVDFMAGGVVGKVPTG
jgi:hypothetical protein